MMAAHVPRCSAKCSAWSSGLRWENATKRRLASTCPPADAAPAPRGLGPHVPCLLCMRSQRASLLRVLPTRLNPLWALRLGTGEGPMTVEELSVEEVLRLCSLLGYEGASGEVAGAEGKLGGCDQQGGVEKNIGESGEELGAEVKLEGSAEEGAGVEGKLGASAESLREALQQLVQQPAPQHDASQLADLIIACEALGVPWGALLDEASSTFTEQAVAELPERQLTRLFLACCSRCPATPLTLNLLSRLASPARPPLAPSHSLTLLHHLLAHHRYLPSPAKENLAVACTSSLSPHIKTLRTGQVALVVCCLGVMKVGGVKRGLLRALAERFDRGLTDASAENVSRVLVGFAKLGWRPPFLLQRIVQRLNAHPELMDEFSTPDLVRLIASLAQLNASGPPTLKLIKTVSILLLLAHTHPLPGTPPQTRASPLPVPPAPAPPPVQPSLGSPTLQAFKAAVNSAAKQLATNFLSAANAIANPGASSSSSRSLTSGSSGSAGTTMSGSSISSFNANSSNSSSSVSASSSSSSSSSNNSSFSASNSSSSTSTSSSSNSASNSSSSSSSSSPSTSGAGLYSSSREVPTTGSSPSTRSLPSLSSLTPPAHKALRRRLTVKELSSITWACIKCGYSNKTLISQLLRLLMAAAPVAEARGCLASISPGAAASSGQAPTSAATWTAAATSEQARFSAASTAAHSGQDAAIVGSVGRSNGAAVAAAANPGQAQVAAATDDANPAQGPLPAAAAVTSPEQDTVSSAVAADGPGQTAVSATTTAAGQGPVSVADTAAGLVKPPISAVAAAVNLGETPVPAATIATAPDQAAVTATAETPSSGPSSAAAAVAGNGNPAEPTAAAAPRLPPMVVAQALWACGHLKFWQDGLDAWVEAHMMDPLWEGRVGCQNLAMVAWGLAACGRQPSQQFLDALVHASTQAMHEFKAWELSALMWALAGWEQQLPGSFQEAVMHHLRAHAASFSMWNLCSVIMSLDRLLPRVPHSLLSPLEQRLLPHTHPLQYPALSWFLFCCQRNKYRPTRLVPVLCASASDYLARVSLLTLDELAPRLEGEARSLGSSSSRQAPNPGVSGSSAVEARPDAENFAPDFGLQDPRSQNLQEGGPQSTQGLGSQGTQEVGSQNWRQAGQQNPQDVGSQNIRALGSWSSNGPGAQSPPGLGVRDVRTAAFQNPGEVGSQISQEAGSQSIQQVGPQDTQEAGSRSSANSHVSSPLARQQDAGSQAVIVFKVATNPDRDTRAGVQEAESAARFVFHARVRRWAVQLAALAYGLGCHAGWMNKRPEGRKAMAQVMAAVEHEAMRRPALFPPGSLAGLVWGMSEAQHTPSSWLTRGLDRVMRRAVPAMSYKEVSLTLLAVSKWHQQRSMGLAQAAYVQAPAINRMLQLLSSGQLEKQVKHSVLVDSVVASSHLPCYSSRLLNRIAAQTLGRLDTFNGRTLTALLAALSTLRHDEPRLLRAVAGAYPANPTWGLPNLAAVQRMLGAFAKLNHDPGENILRAAYEKVMALGVAERLNLLARGENVVPVREGDLVPAQEVGDGSYRTAASSSFPVGAGDSSFRAAANGNVGVRTWSSPFVPPLEPENNRQTGMENSYENWGRTVPDGLGGVDSRQVGEVSEMRECVPGDGGRQSVSRNGDEWEVVWPSRGNNLQAPTGDNKGAGVSGEETTFIGSNFLRGQEIGRDDNPQGRTEFCEDESGWARMAAGVLASERSDATNGLLETSTPTTREQNFTLASSDGTSIASSPPPPGSISVDAQFASSRGISSGEVAREFSSGETARELSSGEAELLLRENRSSSSENGQMESAYRRESYQQDQDRLARSTGGNNASTSSQAAYAAGIPRKNGRNGPPVVLSGLQASNRAENFDQLTQRTGGRASDALNRSGEAYSSRSSEASATDPSPGQWNGSILKRSSERTFLGTQGTNPRNEDNSTLSTAPEQNTTAWVESSSGRHSKPTTTRSEPDPTTGDSARAAVQGTARAEVQGAAHAGMHNTAWHSATQPGPATPQEVNTLCTLMYYLALMKQHTCQLSVHLAAPLAAALEADAQLLEANRRWVGACLVLAKADGCPSPFESVLGPRSRRACLERWQQQARARARPGSSYKVIRDVCKVLQSGLGLTTESSILTHDRNTSLDISFQYAGCQMAIDILRPGTNCSRNTLRLSGEGSARRRLQQAANIHVLYLNRNTWVALGVNWTGKIRAVKKLLKEVRGRKHLGAFDEAHVVQYGSGADWSVSMDTEGVEGAGEGGLPVLTGPPSIGTPRPPDAQSLSQADPQDAFNVAPGVPAGNQRGPGSRQAQRLQGVLHVSVSG